MTDDLNAMVTWLMVCGVDTVALEPTGVYWIPVFECWSSADSKSGWSMRVK